MCRNLISSFDNDFFFSGARHSRWQKIVFYAHRSNQNVDDRCTHPVWIMRQSCARVFSVTISYRKPSYSCIYFMICTCACTQCVKISVSAFVSFALPVCVSHSWIDLPLSKVAGQVTAMTLLFWDWDLIKFSYRFFSSSFLLSFWFLRIFPLDFLFRRHIQTNTQRIHHSVLTYIKSSHNELSKWTTSHLTSH